MKKAEIKPDWRLVRVEQTQHCNAEYLEKKASPQSA